MPPKKKIKLAGQSTNDAVAMVIDDGLMAIVFGFLSVNEIMRHRCVCKNWREAAKKSIISTEFKINSVEKYNAMRVMTAALPNLQHICIKDPRGKHKWNDGEDPDDPVRASYSSLANWTSHEIEIISNFTKLRTLEMYSARLNGRYPVLFNFPMLQKLTIWNTPYLKWDLEMLSGTPLLKELVYMNNLNPFSGFLTGNIVSLRVLKDTLEKVIITYCNGVEGNFMDLADFPRLKVLCMQGTSVTGDIRDIGGEDLFGDNFSQLETLELPKSVCGAPSYAFGRISEVPGYMQMVHRLMKRGIKLCSHQLGWSPVLHSWSLSRESPDWYDSRTNPFVIEFMNVGSRLGWRWKDESPNGSCEINWLDAEPEILSSDYDNYIEALNDIEEQTAFYIGHYQPPTEEEYSRLRNI